jgi:hypothetical protein
LITQVKKQKDDTGNGKRLIISAMKTISPVDGRGPSVPGQDGRVINDGAMLGAIDYIHGDELCAEGKHI